MKGGAFGGEREAAMSTFRVNKNVNYTVMSNHHLQDKRLSLKAKGLLSYMLSLPDDWDYSLKGLTVGCKDGLDSVRTAVLELEEHGYVRRQKVRNAKGQIIDYDYQVYESPVEDAPAVPGKEGGPSNPSATKSPKSLMKPCSSPFLDFPNLAEPNLEKATQQNTNKQNTKRQSTNLSGPTGESADFDQMEAQVREEFRERLEIDTLAQREGDICSDMNSYEIYTTLQSILIQPIIIKNNILQQHKNEPLMDKLKLIDVSSESSLQKRLRVAFKGLRP